MDFLLLCIHERPVTDDSVTCDVVSMTEKEFSLFALTKEKDLSRASSYLSLAL